MKTRDDEDDILMKIEFWSPDVRVDANIDLLCFRYVDPV